MVIQQLKIILTIFLNCVEIEGGFHKSKYYFYIQIFMSEVSFLEGWKYVTKNIQTFNPRSN